MNDLPPNARSARVIEVIEVVTKEGGNHDTQGHQLDVVREVTRYYTRDGDLLAERDDVGPAMVETTPMGATEPTFVAGAYGQRRPTLHTDVCALQPGHPGPHYDDRGGWWS